MFHPKSETLDFVATIIVVVLVQQFDSGYN